MKKRVKLTPIPRQRLQDLRAPGGGQAGSSAGTQRRGNAHSGRRSGYSIATRTSMTLEGAQMADSMPANVPSPSVPTTTSKASEQLELTLGREVMRFRTFNAESMAVAFKPDKSTEIFLHLARSNGEVDVKAQFDRGDFSALSCQWNQLQETMRQRGVKLNALEESPDQAKSHSHFGHGRKQSRQVKNSANMNRVGTLDERMVFRS